MLCTIVQVFRTRHRCCSDCLGGVLRLWLMGWYKTVKMWWTSLSRRDVKLETFFQVGLFLGGSLCSIVCCLHSCLRGKLFDVSVVMKNSLLHFLILTQSCYKWRNYEVSCCYVVQTTSEYDSCKQWEQAIVLDRLTGEKSASRYDFLNVWYACNCERLNELPLFVGRVLQLLLQRSIMRVWKRADLFWVK